MYLLVWEFRVPAARQADFERVYGADGDWVQLFRRGAGYLGSELARDTADPLRYLTVDRWTAREAYDAFRAAHAADYGALDRSCEALTAAETPIGAFLDV